MYTIVDEIGEGAFGQVFRVTSVSTGKEYAAKAIDKNKVKKPETIVSEIECLKKLDHPNVIKLYEVYDMKDQKLIVLVFELLRGTDVFARVKQLEYFDERMARAVFKQVMQAIHFLHENNISHRDIKPENFVFINSVDSGEDDYKIKILDFGLASSFNCKKDESIESAQKGKRYHYMTSYVGSAFYQSPEVLK